MRIRVLQFTWRLSAGGGIPATVRDTLTRLDPEAFDLHLCSVRPFFAADGVDRLPPTVARHTLGIEGPPTARSRLRILAGLRRVARQVRPDVLHTHSGVGWYSLLWRLTSGRRVPALLEVHDAPQSGRTSRTNRRVEGWMLRRLGYRAVVHSSSVRDDVSKAYRLDPSALSLVPIGIDTGRMARPAVDRQSWRVGNGIDMDVPVVLYVARLVPSKNLPLFVDVAAAISKQVPEARFIVLGDGPERDGAEDLVRTRGMTGTVQLLGFREDLVEAYHAADVFLSTSDYEGFGIAVLEAMAAGLPVVSTSVGGVVDLVVPDRTGMLAASGDAAALADAVVELIEHPLRRQRLGAAGRERARQQFDVSSMVTGYEALYRELTGCR